MNKLFAKIATLLVGSMMAIGVGVAIGSNQEARVAEATADGYFDLNCKFKTSKDGTGTNPASDGGVEINTFAKFTSQNGTVASKISDVNYYYYFSGDASRIDSTSYSAAKLYAGSDDSFKFASGGGAGTLSFSLSGSSIYIRSVVLTAKSGKSSPTITIAEANSSTKTQTPTASYGDLTFTYDGTTTKSISITVPKDKMTYVSNIRVNYSIPVTSLAISGTGVSENALSISSDDTSDHTINVSINSDALDKQVNVAHQSGTEGLFTLGGLTSGHITCNASGIGSFTVTGTEATTGSETFRIVSESTPSKYVDLIVTALDDSVTYYTVSFDSDGGSVSPVDKLIESGETFEFPSPGTKEHYSFDGWTSDLENLFDVGDTSPAVVDDIEYLAFWTEDAKYTVTYVAGSNGTGSYAHNNQYVGSYTLLGFASLTGVSADSGYRFKDFTVSGVLKNPGNTVTLSAALEVTVNFELIPLVYEVTFGTEEGTAGLSNFSNTSYVIPSGVALSNIQGYIYGKNDNTSSSIRFGKGSEIGSFDATIGDGYYIKKITANLKYYSSDTTAKFAVTPSGGSAIEKTMTSSFADYEYDVSGSYTNKVTLGTTINGKRAFLSGFSINYGKTWSKLLLDTFTCSGVTIQDPNGRITVDNPTSVWSVINAEYNNATDAQKLALKTKPANQSGTIDEQALARYDLVIKKYGTGTYTDFLGRFQEGGINYAARVNNFYENNTFTSDKTITIIIVISASALIAVGGYFLLRRKHDDK